MYVYIYIHTTLKSLDFVKFYTWVRVCNEFRLFCNLITRATSSVGSRGWRPQWSLLKWPWIVQFGILDCRRVKLVVLSFLHCIIHSDSCSARIHLNTYNILLRFRWRNLSFHDLIKFCSSMGPWQILPRASARFWRILFRSWGPFCGGSCYTFEGWNSTHQLTFFHSNRVELLQKTLFSP